jgi:hypothetical protein
MWQMKIFHLDILSNKCHKNIFLSIGIILAKPHIASSWVHEWKKGTKGINGNINHSEGFLNVAIYMTYSYGNTHIIILWCCPFSVQQVQTREGNSKKECFNYVNEMIFRSFKSRWVHSSHIKFFNLSKKGAKKINFISFVALFCTCCYFFGML